MGGEPGPDRRHRHVLAGDLAPGDQHAADRRIGMAVLGRVAKTHHAPVRQADPARALDLKKEGVGPRAQIEQRPRPPAIVVAADFGAGVIGNEPGGDDLADDALAFEQRREGGGVDRHQIGRDAIGGFGKQHRPGAAAFQFGFVIAGDLAVAAAGRRHREGVETVLEEAARLGRGGFERRRAGRPPIGGRAEAGGETAGIGEDAGAGGAKCGERAGLVVGGPARQVGVGDGGEVGVRNGAGGERDRRSGQRHGGRAQERRRQRGQCDQTAGAGDLSGGHRMSRPLNRRGRCRRASSWDRPPGRRAARSSDRRRA